MALGNLQSLTYYYWRVSGTNALGTSGWSTVFRFRTILVSGVGEEEVPATFALEQNYPNPFNPVTTIPFSVASAGRVTIVIYDLLGREVERVVDEVRPPGRYEVTWYAAARSSGVYFVRMIAGGFTSVKRLMLVK